MMRVDQSALKDFGRCSIASRGRGSAANFSSNQGKVGRGISSCWN